MVSRCPELGIPDIGVGNIDQPCRSEGAESLLVIASVGRASDNP